MNNCPICKSDAEELETRTPEMHAIRCETHGEFEFSNTLTQILSVVSKRVGSRYVSGRADNWIKVKNPAAPAVKREAEEDWGKIRWQAASVAFRLWSGVYGSIDDGR